jgi:hypothetical protein
MIQYTSSDSQAGSRRRKSVVPLTTSSQSVSQIEQMGKVTDSAGRDVDYLPFDLRAGEETPVLVLKVTRERDGEKLVSQCSQPTLASYLVRQTGSGDPFVDAASEIDLSGLPMDVATDFDVKAKAGNGITGVQRVSLSLVVSYQNAADFKG